MSIGFGNRDVFATGFFFGKRFCFYSKDSSSFGFVVRTAKFFRAQNAFTRKPQTLSGKTLASGLRCVVTSLRSLLNVLCKSAPTNLLNPARRRVGMRQ